MLNNLKQYKYWYISLVLILFLYTTALLLNNQNLGSAVFFPIYLYIILGVVAIIKPLVGGGLIILTSLASMIYLISQKLWLPSVIFIPFIMIGIFLILKRKPVSAKADPAMD